MRRGLCDRPNLTPAFLRPGGGKGNPRPVTERATVRHPGRPAVETSGLPDDIPAGDCGGGDMFCDILRGIRRNLGGWTMVTTLDRPSGDDEEPKPGTAGDGGGDEDDAEDDGGET